MSTRNFIDLSVVELNDGREATVLHVYPGGDAACVEIDETNELLDVSQADIKKIIWQP